MAIKIKKSHKGLLHKNLGVKQGDKIPASKLKVKSTDSVAVKKRKVFAQNAKHWSHKKAANGILVPTDDRENTLADYDRNVENMEIAGERNPSNTIDSMYYNPNYPLGTGSNIVDMQPYNSALTNSLQDYKNNKPVPKMTLPQFQFSGNKYFQRAGQHLNNAINFGAQIPQAANGTSIQNIQLPQNQIPNLPQNPQLQLLPLPQNNTPYTPQYNSSTNNTPYQAPINNTSTYNSNYNQGFKEAGAIAGTIGETALTGINIGKGVLDEIGTNRQNRHELQRESEMDAQNLYAQGMNLQPYDKLGYGASGRNGVLKLGGKIKYAEGGSINDFKAPRMLSNVETESGEFIQTPQGVNGVVSGDKHFDGGEPMNLPPNSIVFSEKLKPADSKKSYAKLAKPFQTKKEFEIIDTKGMDDLAKDTTQMMIQKKNEKLQELFQQQEMAKLNSEHGSKIANETAQEYGIMKNGGKIKMYANGGAGSGASNEVQSRMYDKYFNPETGKYELTPYTPNKNSSTTLTNFNPAQINPQTDSFGNNLTTFGRTEYPPADNPFTSKYGTPYTPGTYPKDYGDMSKFQAIQNNTAATFPNAKIPLNVDPTSIRAVQNVQSTNTPGAITDAYKHGYLNYNNEHERILQSLPEFKALKRKGNQPNYEDYRLLEAHPELVVKGHQDNLWGKDAVKYNTFVPKTKEEYQNWVKDQRNVGEGLYIDKEYIQGDQAQPEYWKTDLSQISPKEAAKVESTGPQFKPIERGKQKFDPSGINIPVLGLPNNYARDPLNYHGVQPNYIDPRYLDIQPQLNEITRGQRAVQSNLGDRSTSSISNILQSQINGYNQQQQAFGQKYNYDRQQDQSVQQFNAQAKTGADQYNQQTEFSQLEDPRRRREGFIDTQKRTDAQGQLENQMKERSYNMTKQYIQDTFNPFSGSQYADSPITLSNSAFLKPNNGMTKKVFKDKPGNNNDETDYYYKKYGGKVKIKPKMRKK